MPTPHGPIRWLVIGIGDITRRRVIPAIQSEPRSELYAIVTRHPAKAAPYAGARVWSDLDDALADPAIDAVYIATPVSLHAPQTIACLSAGKHVLCEKPTAMNYGEARRMVDVAKECRRTFGVAYYRRLYPKAIRVKELLAFGAIGQPVYAEAWFHGEHLPPADRAWLMDPAMAGGGPLYDIASHRIDILNFWFGTPVRATGQLSNVVHKIAVEDSATTMVEYESGVRAIVDVRWHSNIVRDECRIIGTDGELNLTPLSGPPLRGAGLAEEWPCPENVHSPLIENFVAALLDGAPLASSGESAIATDWITSEVVAASSRRFR